VRAVLTHREIERGGRGQPLPYGAEGTSSRAAESRESSGPMRISDYELMTLDCIPRARPRVRMTSA
jgi:hypothetical protein